MKNEIIENEIVNDEFVYDEIQPLDAYDNYYYQQILSSLNDVKENQNTIIENFQTNIACHQVHNNSFNVICVLLGIVVCYMIIRDMLHL